MSETTSYTNSDPQTAPEFDAIIVGAGFAGMYALHRLRSLGLSARVLERGAGVGGTWYWNRYPGARCDVESVDYSFSFSEELQQEWVWTERYATQPEILRYLNHVADRFDLRRDIQLDTRVVAAHFNETASVWRVVTEAGEAYTARFCVMASGNLSSIKRPSFPGLESFQGEWHHTAEWPQEGVEFSGKRVGVVGTGSTGIQLIPQIAKTASHLYVFQRTPNFSLPAQNEPLDPELLKEVKASYPERRTLSRESQSGVPYSHPKLAPQRSALTMTEEEREQALEEGWQLGSVAGIMLAFTDTMLSLEANAYAAEFVRRKIRSTVEDQAVAELLCPHDHPIGARRVCVDIEYFETYNRDNVTLVDVRQAPIQQITPTGLETATEQYELDAIVFAIGFDAITGPLAEIDIRGRGGLSLKEKWADGPSTYLGLAVPGFPNLFTVTGPGGPAVLSNVAVSIEQHVDWITDCIEYTRSQGIRAIEADHCSEAAWMQRVDDAANETLYPLVDSWYNGSNIPGKPRRFSTYVGGVGNYRAICDEVVANGYAGFLLTASEKSEHAESVG